MLREVRDEDLAILFDHQADPEGSAMAAFPSRDRAAFDDHWAWIRMDASTVLRTIEVEGRVAGSIGSFPEGERRMVGYWLGPEHWGRGIASKALAEFLAIDEERPLHATVAAHNVASQRVLEKCGFERVGGGDVLTFVLR
jgi:RimJ/RimL family protein N-acetyltransferase